MLRRGYLASDAAGMQVYRYANVIIAIRERDHRDGTDIRLLRQEVAKELPELPQCDDCFFVLDGVTLLRRGDGQFLLKGDHLLFLINQQAFAGNLMGNGPDGRRRDEFRFLQGHGDAGGVCSDGETLGAQVVADGVS